MQLDNIHFQGNRHLRRAGVEFSYTEEQIIEIAKCATDPIYFIKNYIYIINLDEGLVKFNLHDFQEKMVNTFHNEKRIICCCPRQIGKTVSSAAYLLHFILFNENKTTAILGNKESIAREILHRIKTMYENLPLWLQCGVTEWNKSSIEIENGSRIITAATSSSAIRGMSLNVLFLDEFGFVPSGVFDEFITSVYPTISSSKESKIIMVSTPNGLNHFYKMWTEAQDGKNGYTAFEIAWNDPPGRDEEWREKMISEIGLERFNQEFAANFLGSSNTLINSKILANIPLVDPKETQFDGKFRIIESPQPNMQYILIVDVAEGVGGDSSTIQIIKNENNNQFTEVAAFEDNTIKPNIFYEVINQIGKYYNTGLVIIELNSIGFEVANLLNFDAEYPNIFFDKDFGLKVTKMTKRVGCAQLKDLVERELLIIKDFETINQLSTFVRQKNGTFSAEKNKHDDLVMPLVLFSYFINNKEYTDIWLEENVQRQIHNKTFERIEQDLLPFGWLDDGDEEAISFE